MATTPTVAIGIGAAGARMLSELSEFVKNEGEEENFRYIAIDSNEQDVRTLKPDTAYPIPLTIPEDQDERAHHIQNYEYLRNGTSVGTQGTDRKRSVARYFVDNPHMYSDLRDQLETQITKFWQSRKDSVGSGPSVTELNIWLIHSFGGGTGSGAFPIIGTILYRIIQSEDLEASIFGLGSIARLDGLEDYELSPSETQFYTNTYTGLHELKQIVEHDYNSPLEISLEAAKFDEEITNSRLELDQNPFEMYWLIGYDEEIDSANYRNRMNEIAAASIYYYANKTSVENFPDDNDYADNVLYGITVGELHTPIELAERFVDLESEIKACEKIASVLEAELENHKESRKYLQEVRETQLGIRDVDPQWQVGLPQIRRKWPPLGYRRSSRLQRCLSPKSGSIPRLPECKRVPMRPYNFYLPLKIAKTDYNLNISLFIKYNLLMYYKRSRRI